MASLLNHYLSENNECVEIGLPDPTRPLTGHWPGSVHELFARQAEQSPERDAVVDCESRLDYRELDGRSNQLAGMLREHGIGREDLVAIYAHRSTALVVAILGILKSGAAFVILDPAYPPARLLQFLELAQPRGWIELSAARTVAPAVQKFLSSSSIRCRVQLAQVALWRDNDPLQRFPTDNRACTTVAPDDLAYVAFTSGSTGSPKGILGRHGPLTAFLPWQQRCFELTESDRFSLLSGLSHDPLHRDVFTPLCVGASIWIPEPDEFLKPGWLSRWCEKSQITNVHLTPALLQLLTQMVPGKDIQPLTALRYAYVVGDVLTRRHVADLQRIAPNVRCVNFYGSTETQRSVGYHVVTELPAADTGVIPLGRGIPGVQLLIQRDDGLLADIGEVGEIHVRSAQLARGYLGDEELTAKRFVPNPHTCLPQDLLYRTGDLGRYRSSDGTVEFAGRVDDQVQIRGVRVEPGDIQATLMLHPTVRQCVVTVDGPQSNHRLIAYYVTVQPESLGCDTSVTQHSNSHIPNSQQLREFLRERLPELMVPAVFVLLESLPLTPNGKIDRTSLPIVHDGTLSTSNLPDNESVTPTEREMARIWCEVFRRDWMGRCVNFFELGGDSLKVIHLLSCIAEFFNVELSLSDVFAYPTVAELSLCVERKAALPVSLAPLQPCGRKDKLPLSRSQEALWFLQQVDPHSRAYHLTYVLSLRGNFNPATFKRALAGLAQRHELLRCSVVVDSNRPMLKVYAELPIDIREADLRKLPFEQRRVKTEQLLRDDASRAFDLVQGPLLRMLQVRLQDNEYCLLLTVHHLISDGWSQTILIRELTTLYRALVIDEQPPLTDLSVQFADFVLWQRDWLGNELLDDHRSYWSQKLTALPQFELPTYCTRTAIRSDHGQRIAFSFPEEQVQQLRTIGRHAGATTLFQSLLAVLKVQLFFAIGQDDVVVGTDIANRPRIETRDLIGLFVNQLVLRTSLSGDPDFWEVLKRICSTTLEAYAHPWLPFPDLVRLLNPQRDPTRNPLFQIMFVQQESPEFEFVAEGLEFSRSEFVLDTTVFDLSVHFWSESNAVRGYLLYNSDLFESRTIVRLRDQMSLILKHVTVQPNIRLSALRTAVEGSGRQQEKREQLDQARRRIFQNSKRSNRREESL